MSLLLQKGFSSRWMDLFFSGRGDHAIKQNFQDKIKVEMSQAQSRPPLINTPSVIKTPKMDFMPKICHPLCAISNSRATQSQKTGDKGMGQTNKILALPDCSTT